MIPEEQETPVVSSRRSVLTSVCVVATGGLAGCSGNESEPENSSSPADEVTDNPTDERDGTDGESTTTTTEQAQPIKAWPTFQYDAGHTGSVPNGIGPIDDVTERWNNRLAQKSGLPYTVDTSPAVADDTVFIGGPENKFYALDAADGTEQWSIEGVQDRTFGTPVVTDGTVYVADGGEVTDDTTLYALDASDGTEQWSVELIQNTVAPTPVVSGETVFMLNAGGVAGSLRAFDSSDGTERWRIETDGRGGISVADGTVYVSQGNLIAYDTTDGSEQWSTPFDGGGTLQAPAVDDGVVYTAFLNPLTGDPDNVYAVNATDGSTQWSTNIPPDTNDRVEIASSPAVSDDTVFVLTEEGLYALNRANGSERWSVGIAGVEVGAFVTNGSSPIIVRDTVYVKSGDGNVYALSAVDGSELWSFEVGERSTSTPAVADNTVYVGGLEGRLYALTEP